LSSLEEFKKWKRRLILCKLEMLSKELGSSFLKWLLKPMHPSSSRAFPRHQEHDLKHPGSLDLITTKQNKLPSFIDNLGGGLGNRKWGILDVRSIAARPNAKYGVQLLSLTM
jgi:hypothetical protein